ncbi:PDZ domain-containing protein [Thalassorhabdus alkalitolerans]
MGAIGWELLIAIGRFFAHPLTYIFLIAMILLGYRRVKKERADFHTRVQDTLDDLLTPMVPGLLAGAAVSIVILLAGASVPWSFLLLVGLLYVVFLLTGRAWLLSPSYVLGLAVLIAYFIPSQLETGNMTVDGWLQTLAEANLMHAVLLLALFMLAEGILILKNGQKHTSPLLKKSTRGKWIGAHKLQRLWFVPLFVFVPGGEIEGLGWWPVLPIGDGGLALWLVPMAIGTSFTIYHTLPWKAASLHGQRVIGAGILALAGAVAAYFYPVFVLVTAIVAIVLRIAASIVGKIQEDSNPPFFTMQTKGVKVLGVIPGSPAEKMELKPGEIIMRVNGIPVNGEKDFYKALQRNSAYCKLDVADLNGEIRFAQSTVFHGAHHHVGVLLVKRKEAPEEETG